MAKEKMIAAVPLCKDLWTVTPPLGFYAPRGPSRRGSSAFAGMESPDITSDIQTTCTSVG
jgi:hypothetical protein